MRTNRARDSIARSVKDGLFWSVMTGFVDAYYLPFAIFLGASTLELGFLRAFPVLLGSALLFITDHLTVHFKSRKKVLYYAVTLQSAALVLACSCGFFDGKTGLYLLMGAVAAYISLGLMVAPPWASLMAEYLPADKRGCFLGWRERILGISLISFGLIAGWVLHSLKADEALGFFILFAVAALARLGSARQIAGMYEPPYHENAAEKCSYLDFITGRKSTNTSAFVTASAVMMFGTYITVPFFSLYMLGTLQFTYWQYTAVIMSGQLTTYLFSQHWGSLADTYGSRKVMLFSALAIPVIPLLWGYFTHWYFLCAVEFFAGLSWSAFTRASGNFMYDSAESALRTRYISFLGVTTGLAQFAGALGGGFIFKYFLQGPVHEYNARPFFYLLGVSMFFRAVATLMFVGVKEPKHKSIPFRSFLIKAMDLRRFGVQR